MRRTKRRGFTLVELVVVVAIITVSVPAIFSLFFSIFRARSKIYILQELKKNGDYSINVMSNLIKQRAISIHTDPGVADVGEICSTKSRLDSNSSSAVGQLLYFKDLDGRMFYFTTKYDRISSYSSFLKESDDDSTDDTIGVNSGSLMSGNTRVDNWGLSCYRTNPFSPPIVTVRFTVLPKKSSASSVQEERAGFDYAANIKLRN